MTRNNKFARLLEDEKHVKYLDYAPNVFKIEGVGVIGNPPKRDYLRAGYKEVTGIKPPERPGYHIITVGYKETEEEIEVQYNYEADPVLPRHWTPLSIKRTVEKHDLPDGTNAWTLLRGMLVQMNYLEDFWGSQFIAEDDEVYIKAYNAACQQFGQDVIDQLLNEIPVEP